MFSKILLFTGAIITGLAIGVGLNMLLAWLLLACLSGAGIISGYTWGTMWAYTGLIFAFNLLVVLPLKACKE